MVVPDSKITAIIGDKFMRTELPSNADSSFALSLSVLSKNQTVIAYLKWLFSQFSKTYYKFKTINLDA